MEKRGVIEKRGCHSAKTGGETTKEQRRGQSVDGSDG